MAFSNKGPRVQPVPPTTTASPARTVAEARIVFGNSRVGAVLAIDADVYGPRRAALPTDSKHLDVAAGAAIAPAAQIIHTKGGGV